MFFVDDDLKRCEKKLVNMKTKILRLSYTRSPCITAMNNHRLFAIVIIAIAVCGMEHAEALSYADAKAATRLEMAAEKRATIIHRLDTAILLMFVSMLVVIVLTTWFFKHHRLRFIHETGLTLIYGIFIGILLRYFNLGIYESQSLDVVPKNGSSLFEPPDYLRLSVSRQSKKDDNVQFHYELIEGFFADTKQHEERHLEQKTSFSPEIFFNILLPPIIFSAGYSLKKRHFFRNIGSILSFVFIGTTVSCLSVGFVMYVFCGLFGMPFTFQELLFFGAVISATDPVTVLAVFSEMRVESDLFALVFGESCLNDAVAIVLSQIIDNFSASPNTVFDFSELCLAMWNFGYVFFGSLFLGSFIGCLNASFTKFTSISEFPLLESSLFVLFSYISFLVAEVVELTGIVAVLFCGICQAHYTYNNLSEESQIRTKQFFESLSFLSESFIFCYIGVSIIISNNQKWSIIFLLCAIVSIVFARALYVYPLCVFLNIRRRPVIPKSYQHMIVFSGLRGAMAFALAGRNISTANRQIMSTTTSMIVILTVLFNGGLTSWMVDRLGIKHGEALDRRPPEDGDATRPESQPTTPVSGQNPWDKAFLPRKWYNFDAYFMKPLLTHASPSLMQTMPSVCLPLARILSSKQQREQFASQLNNSDSLDCIVDQQQESRLYENPFTRAL
uniref:Sodium/hydrogen exchanger n=1 Tax=Steinernema glaseri TaxID=37863 RepID=A0A1I7YMA2_9BILA